MICMDHVVTMILRYDTKYNVPIFKVGKINSFTRLNYYCI